MGLNGLKLLLDKLKRLVYLVFHIDLYGSFLYFFHFVSIFFGENQYPNLVQ